MTEEVKKFLQELFESWGLKLQTDTFGIPGIVEIFDEGDEGGHVTGFYEPETWHLPAYPQQEEA